VKIALNGRSGKVGSVLAPALEAAGHELVELDDAEVMVDFTAPDAVESNVAAALEHGVPCVIGTSNFDQGRVDALARERGIACFYAPNFALGAVLMMRFAREAAALMPRAEIIELHNETKKDAPSGTAKATAELLGSAPAIHSVRLPGLVAHQEVLFGEDGQLLTIRHDAFSRAAYVPGVLIALERIQTLPPGLTVGLETLL
jgi:4-hydroxy-tetrahydrodipicolinate reductase